MLTRTFWAAAVLLAGVVAAGCSHSRVAGHDATPETAVPSSTAPTQAVAAPTRTSVAPAQDTAPLIDRVSWTTTDNGRQLQVFPTSAGRTDAAASASGRAWAEILEDAPNADTPGMYDQFLCHWNFARIVQPDKASWNLEPWRPAVGYQATVDALCNPGGSES